MSTAARVLRERRLTQARHAARTLYQAGARRVWLFGSLARGEFIDTRTDIDLAVEGLKADQRWDAIQQLRTLLRCKIDVIGIEEAGPALRHSIGESRVLLPFEPAITSPIPGECSQTDVSPATRPVGLHQQRLQTVLDLLKTNGVDSVIDFGCGTGLLLERMVDERCFQAILGVDISYGAIEAARRRLSRGRTSPFDQRRVRLLHSPATNPDPRFIGYDAVTAVEVIEHLDPERLSAFERVVFSYIRPSLFIVTTPNAEYNVFMEVDESPVTRHYLHRFEWTREQFREWISRAATRTGYRYEFRGIGAEDRLVGAPTQMAVCIAPDDKPICLSSQCCSVNEQRKR